MKKWIYQLVPVIILLLAILAEPFYAMDCWVCDVLYRQVTGTHRNIKLIGIDEETLEAYGNFNIWSRERLAELIEKLSAKPEEAPAVIALDIMLIGENNPETDARLAAACENAGNVVAATNLVYRGTAKVDAEGEFYYDTNHIENEEVSYEALRPFVEEGFSNTFISSDGYIRYTQPQVTWEEGRESFAFCVYRMYQEKRNASVVFPETNDYGQMQFFYSGKVGEFAYVSLKDVLEGTVPISEFEDCIVFVGAYAPGFQDAYAVAADRGKLMYGMEIHANIVQALLQGKTATPADRVVHGLIAAAVLEIYLWVVRKAKLGVSLGGTVLLAGVHMLAGRYLALRGITISQVYVLGILALLFLYFIIEKYVLERLKRKHLLTTFKKYVAPQVVDELSKNGNFEVRLGGEKRDVAVLFVDIRGFTPLSESLAPECVVQILNEYLALTTASVFKHNGTLDKFIGDATMAVFNAPFDLADYVYCAVCAAWDMRAGAEELGAHLQEKFGKTVNFGIGINCGEAVVGNIGCDFRMDYTAIGDTVNTAARLESNARPGEILISEAVYEIVKDRVLAEYVDALTLKGKKEMVQVYRVTGMPQK